MNKYLCIHGHFYQPPRENPWTGLIDEQKSAAPFHDWNERIASECYVPNARTQILNNQNQPINTVNNYSKISFNFGPTLLSWMQHNEKEAYQSILDADRESLKTFSGHGAAIAQAYNHMIMPLSNDRDKETQAIWGLKDFEYRFKRRPEGMWLPETAVDLESLEVMAKHGVKFTILAPSQAAQVRRIGTEHWTDVSEGTIDTQFPYLCRLPSGHSINLFFYDGSIANETAFAKLLKNGVDFAERLIGAFPEHQQTPRLVHIANDGETYGHHHAFGNMALAYMIHYVESNQLAEMTVYGEFLEQYPPAFEVQVIEDTSWSCFHGVERWKAHCGCRLNVKLNWNQEWRTFLREGLDQLRDRLAGIFENEMAGFYDDPWDLRNKYIEVLLDPSEENRKKWLWSAANRDLDKKDRKKILNLLEMQRHGMLMFTSCGWFFDDISGIETIQILQYAARAIQLAQGLTEVPLETEFLAKLELAKSNVPQMVNGKTIYDRFVKTAMVGTE